MNRYSETSSNQKMVPAHQVTTRQVKKFKSGAVTTKVKSATAYEKIIRLRGSKDLKNSIMVAHLPSHERFAWWQDFGSTTVAEGLAVRKGKPAKDKLASLCNRR